MISPGGGMTWEVLYETDRTRVSRVWPAGGAASVIRKEPLGRSAVQRIRHERRMLRRLAGVTGVTQLAPGAGDDEIVLQDVRGETLATVIGGEPPTAEMLVDFALELARIVGAVHRAGMVHRDINPANLVVTGAARRPTLIDFDLAGTFVEHRPAFTHHRQIVGTLPYLAPEQTGRTGMAVDERADLYALGTTLYELATGVPPFAVGDPLRMVHDVLAVLPVPPVEVAARVPGQLSAIVMRLLEKEPDRRYQSAGGLEYDLTRLAEDLARHRDEPFDLGQRDFRLRLAAPSRLIGRKTEIQALRAAFDDALTGGSRGVFVAGAPGVGKTVLVNALRSVVTERGGWFVTGKFDQLRQDLESDAVVQALRGVGRLLLAGTDTEVAAARVRITATLGSDLALAGSIPEFAALLDVGGEADAAQPGDGNARVYAARLRQTSLDLLRAVASPTRPVVMVLDDLQWAGATPVEYIDAVLAEQRLAGVLLVGIYRQDEVDAAHPLATALARWEQLAVAPATLRLDNLPPADLGELLGDMLRLPAAQAAGLAAAVGARTGGNPFDTVELVNALRRDGVLVAGQSGWTWDAATIRRFVGRGDVVDLLAARIEQLPAAARELMEVMACLGGEVELELLRMSADLTADALDERLIAPLEDGLLVLEHGGEPAVRFRHDRVQQAVYGRMVPSRREALHVMIARRLAPVPPRAAFAAEQYLESVGSVRDPAERRVAAGLFVATAATLAVFNPVSADRFLTAAMTLLQVSGGMPVGDPLYAEARRQRHAVLYGLGRLADADAVYARIEDDGTDPFELIEPACIQVASLTNRGQSGAAVALGLALLRRLGVDVPESDFAAEVTRHWGELTSWAAGLSLADDLARPEPDQRVGRIAALLATIVPAAFSCDPPIGAWLILVPIRRLWADHGPCAPLVGALGGAISATLPRGDFHTGYLIGKHVLAVGEVRGYEPGTSVARQAFSVLAQHWFEPLEDSVAPSQRAREGLVRAGSLQMACLAYTTSLAALFDCAPTVEHCADDAESAIAFAERTGNRHAAGSFVVYRQLVRALRGETAAPGSFCTDDFDDADFLAGVGSTPRGTSWFHIHRALAATLFGDAPGQRRHAAAAMKLLRSVLGFYPLALAHLLQALALAEQIRTLGPAESTALLVELDSHRDWLAARAATAGGNFGHLVTLLSAERAWALGETVPALRAFDQARREVAARRRPWHQALISERAALFHLAVGLEQSGRDLLAETRRQYDAWCATGKVRQLDEDHPFLRAPATRQSPGTAGQSRTPASSSITADDIDMLAILRTSQALSSETSLDRLRTRVGDLLSAMTGATTVMIALRGDAADWLLWDTTGGTMDAVRVEDAVGRFPLSTLRYVERTGEPLLVEDATADDRFARDPYLAVLDRCSLLVLPLFSHGVLHAVLVLENRLGEGAFSADRLHSVMLVTGQLTVSLHNARLYDSLERKVAERTAALEDANLALEALSNTDALTGLANRRQFDATLEAEWQRAARLGTGLGLAMIDVDHFKVYNDVYGHVAGDECLRLVAAALRSGIRGHVDVVSRYGGEEFAVILPGADLPGVLAVAERIRAEVAALGQPHGRTAAGIVTVSVGAAVCEPGALIKVDELVADAELCLYRAKEQGRNRVVAGPRR